MKCAICHLRGTAVMECVPERISEQFSRGTCSEMRSDMHFMAAVPRKWQIARFMRQPPYGG
eukprot:9129051-Lingulodinium_polyedra.AAC.1